MAFRQLRNRDDFILIYCTQENIRSRFNFAPFAPVVCTNFELEVFLFYDNDVWANSRCAKIVLRYVTRLFFQTIRSDQFISNLSITVAVYLQI